MKSRTILALVCCVLLACGKKESGGGGESKPTTVTSAQPVPSAETPPKKPSVAVEVAGAYDAKIAPVRTPEDAPKYFDVEAGALGPGELVVVLPAEDGPVTGKASGSLGAQTFSGLLEDHRLTGTLLPDTGATPRMWGFVIAEVQGDGEARTVVGTLRAGGNDGRTVRESSITLKKK